MCFTSHNHCDKTVVQKQYFFCYLVTFTRIPMWSFQQGIWRIVKFPKLNFDLWHHKEVRYRYRVCKLWSASLSIAYMCHNLSCSVSWTYRCYCYYCLVYMSYISYCLVQSSSSCPNNVVMLVLYLLLELKVCFTCDDSCVVTPNTMQAVKYTIHRIKILWLHKCPQLVLDTKVWKSWRAQV